MLPATCLSILGFEVEDADQEEEKRLEVIPWPGGKEPGGFMRGIKLVALPPALCDKIIRGGGQGETPREKPNIKSPAEAAAYLNSHLNMGEPPKYMAVYKAASGETYYIFSGGIHWGKKPLFSQAAILLESGAIRPYP
ncbi:MAG: hypothetical protein FJ290_18640 [Planctomycetes bacterium]|nr:hypothetical protein [Planctomycetota bacterium]